MLQSEHAKYLSHLDSANKYHDAFRFKHHDIYFFSFVLALVDRVTRYSLLVGGNRYSMELVEVRTSWLGHYVYKKKMTR